MNQPRIELLQQMSIFGGIRDDILAFMLTLAPVVSRRAGEYFFREGDPAESMFVLETGRAAVVKGDESHGATVRELARGDCFGEISLIDFSPRSASVRALEDCTALEISAACLHEVYRRDVEQFAMIEMNMGREVARRIRQLDSALDALRPHGPTRVSKSP